MMVSMTSDVALPTGVTRKTKRRWCVVTAIILFACGFYVGFQFGGSSVAKLLKAELERHKEKTVGEFLEELNEVKG